MEKSKKKNKLLFDFANPFAVSLIMSGLISLSGCASLNSPDARSRCAAIKKISDQGVLAKFALEDEAPVVREAAIEKLTDQTVLAKVALEDEYWHVRQVAVEKLTDQTLLTKIALEGKDSKIRQAAVNKLTDQALLEKLASEDPDLYVQLAAIANLSDMSILEKCARNNTNKAQIAQLKFFLLDPVVKERLGNTKVAVTGWTVLGRYEQLVMRSIHVVSIEKIKIEVSGGNLRKSVIKEYPDSLPGSIIVTNFKFVPASVDISPLVEELLAGFPNEDLEKIYLQYQYAHVRKAAVKKLTDQTVLARAALEDEAPVVRQAAVYKLNDEMLLTKVAREDKNWATRYAAVKELTDQAVLVRVAMEDKDANVREAAEAKLKYYNK